jgi:predicted phage tail protein
MKRTICILIICLPFLSYCQGKQYLVLRKNNKVKQITQGTIITIITKDRTRLVGEFSIIGKDSIKVSNKTFSLNMIQAVVGPKRKEKVVSRTITGSIGLALVVAGISEMQAAKKMDGLGAAGAGAGAGLLMIAGIPFMVNGLIGLLSPQTYNLNKWDLTIE